MFITRLLKVCQLLDKLGLAEVALQILQQDGHILASATALGYLPSQQSKTRIDKGFLFRYGSRGIVVGTGVSDSPAQYIAVFIHHHRFGRGRSQVNPYKASHCRFTPRSRCLAFLVNHLEITLQTILDIG